jgi:hypothetical protein
MGKGHRKGWKKAQKKGELSNRKSVGSGRPGAMPTEEQKPSEIDPSEKARRVKSMWHYLFGWPATSAVVITLVTIGVGVLSMTPPKPTIAQWCFSAALAMLLARFSWWVVMERLDPIRDRLRIPGQGGHDSEIDPVSIPKLIRSRFRDEVGQGFRF